MVKKRIREFNKKLEEDLKDLLSISSPLRLGETLKQRASARRASSKRPKPIPTSPAPPGDEVRFRPTEPFRSEPRVQDYPQFNLPPPRQEMKPVTPIEILEAVINEPTIELTDELVTAINDPGVMMRNGQMFGQFTRSNLLPKKKKRKVSKYQKEFGKQLKLLKKKHPRIPVTRLMKRAHAATRKALKR